MSGDAQRPDGAEFDVAICGGGLAGLTLARQLTRRLADIRVAVVERLALPLPVAAFKVGESTVETGAHYLTEMLGLNDYFARAHLAKMGLRYYFGDPAGPLQERPEFGLRGFPGVSSYQIDRGLLESDLRRLIREDGVTLFEGYAVDDVELATQAPHRVLFSRDNRRDKRALTARWVVDTTGRRRLLQKKLGLGRAFGKACSSAWWRLQGRVDLADLVPASAADWHHRVPDGNRYYSTNHLMGDGYWVWLIALSSDVTSVGIVALEDLHPFETYNTYERSQRWLRRHEPALAAYIGDRQPLDFQCRRKYTYSSRRVFSADRWACIGEAGVFADPYYSPGTDLIGFGNSIATELIARDRENRLTPVAVEELNLFFLALSNFLTQNIQAVYPYLGQAVPVAAKLLWDFGIAWGFVAPQMFNQIFLDTERRNAVREVTAGMFSLTRRMQRLFSDWACKSPGRCHYEFIDYLSIPFLARLRARNLCAGKSSAELIADARANMALMEELSQALFLVAVEDVYPEHLADPQWPTWLNSAGISLDPQRWESEGLFRPTTPERDLSPLRAALASHFRFSETARPTPALTATAAEAPR